LDCLTAHEVVLGVMLEQPQLIGEGASALALCLSNWPEPSSVDVSVTYSRDGVGRGGMLGEEWRYHCSGCRYRSRDVGGVYRSSRGPEGRNCIISPDGDELGQTQEHT
jgi:hypothetical protein